MPMQGFLFFEIKWTDNKFKIIYHNEQETYI